MGLDNTLNVSELLRRLGVKGDSKGSVPLLESLRLSLNIGDLSDLVPPLGGPIGGAGIASASGVGTVNSWSLLCESPGGLSVLALEALAGNFDLFVTAANPFLATTAAASHNFSFGQQVVSEFRSHTPAAKVAPANTFSFGGAIPSRLLRNFENWVGPGEFFNIEAVGQNTGETIRITWKEYPAGLNP